MYLIDIINCFIINDDLQFGFTVGKGCQKTVLVLSSVEDFVIEKGSSVYTVGLNVSKAFVSVIVEFL